MTGICAVSTRGDGSMVIGKNGIIPWFCENDLRWFKFFTLNETIVMGRKTMDSIGRKPLKNRRNIVVSKYLFDVPEGFEVVRTTQDIPPRSIIIGGANLLNQLMDRIDTLFITNIKKSYDGDCFLEPFCDKFRKPITVKEFNDCTIYKFEK